MWSKIRQWFDKINETYYNIGYVILTVIVGVLAIYFGFAAAEVLLGILMKSATYMVSSIIFIKALMGPETNVKEEILKENNSALAILVAGFLIGLGFSIGGL